MAKRIAITGRTKRRATTDILFFLIKTPPKRNRVGIPTRSKVCLIPKDLLLSSLSLTLGTSFSDSLFLSG